MERSHQALKRWLAKQRRPATLEQLQAQLDLFQAYYNEVRPHKAIGRRTPAEAYAAREKPPLKGPSAAWRALPVAPGRLDKAGTVSIRYKSRLRHISVGRAYAGTRVLLLVDERDVRLLTEDGEVLGTGTIDPAKGYQGH